MSGSVLERRRLVVGDIHGGLRGLKQALERADFDNGMDKIIFLGDYVDGWSESAEVIQFLIDLQKESKTGHIFLRGNHDAWCQEWLEFGVKNPIWVPQGGQATINSYIRTALMAEPEHTKFFRQLHNYFVDNENNGFVHGGFVSRRGLGHEAYEADYYWDRDLWGLVILLHGQESQVENIPKYLRYKKHKEIYIGHTSTANWKCKPHYPEYNHPQQPTKNGPITIPMNRCNVWNMDTGGGFKGKITVMDIDTKEFWQSDFLADLYPEEKGRG